MCLIQETSDNSRTGSPRAQVSSAVTRPATAASEAPSVLAANQVSVHVEDAEDSIPDKKVDDNDNDDDDEEIDKVLEMAEMDSEADSRPTTTTSAQTNNVSQTHCSISPQSHLLTLVLPSQHQIFRSYNLYIS